MGLFGRKKKATADDAVTPVTHERIAALGVPVTDSVTEDLVRRGDRPGLPSLWCDVTALPAAVVLSGVNTHLVIDNDMLPQVLEWVEGHNATRPYVRAVATPLGDDGFVVVFSTPVLTHAGLSGSQFGAVFDLALDKVIASLDDFFAAVSHASGDS